MSMVDLMRQCGALFLIRDPAQENSSKGLDSQSRKLEEGIAHGL